ncbi:MULTISPECIES: DUF1823 family protein [Prochlorococcus]|nr:MULTISPECIES: DUF1823 family protein [Prochlorococcus]KGG11299.1 hypothetical protein EV04_1377 [Prochlorococcus marinus str. LG]KGG33727.1 hypothetical protein EV10_0162 [Prochlorococcus marinus str. SS51]KGG36922.1 hypothetical protein EV11_0708 [Prochlorococcus sp. SS52]
MYSPWPLSRDLFCKILSDQISDRFVCNLVWERIGYKAITNSGESNPAGPNTPRYWREKFPEAPQIISKRAASIHLTRSIPKEYKQSLKECLNFEGYSINQLYPRRTRRATAINWLLAWILMEGETIPQSGPLPVLNAAPVDPLKGHPGDPEIF